MLDYLLNQVNVTFIIGAILSIIFGFLIGAERESRGKSAGISTNILICFGAMMFTLISLAIEPSNPGRVAANIVTGIGFLGAGLIIKEKKGYVTGLTTAASVWFTASIGMAIGFGWYVPAFIATLVGILVPRIPHLSGKKPK